MLIAVVYQTKIQAYSMFDASVTQTLFKGLVQLTVGAKNLANVTSIAFNTTASAHSSGAGNMPIAMGRYFFTSIRINIEKR
jgi:outer membrane receptor protein involved in Fe transport